MKNNNDMVKTHFKSAKKIQKQNSLILLGFCTPAMLHIFIFCYVPMFGVIIAFKDFNYRAGIFGSPWVGLDNFMFLFKAQDFVRIVRNTVLYNIAFIVTGMAFSVAIALLVDSISKKGAIKLFQTTYFLPYFISWVVGAFIFEILLDVDKGLFNNVLTSLGFEKVFWYQDTRPWPFILVLATLWKGFGCSSIIYYGAIMAIDQELFEAAKIDGCNGSQVIRHITIPMLAPTLIINLIMSVGGIMRGDFGLFYYITRDSGMLYEVTDIIDTYVIRALRKSGNVSTSSAVGLFQSIIGTIFVLTANKIAKAYDEKTAIL